MNLLLSIVLSAILGYILLMMGPIVGGILAFGIVVGCLFRGVYLLNEIHKANLSKSIKEDHAQERKQQAHLQSSSAYKSYLEEKKREDSNFPS